MRILQFAVTSSAIAFATSAFTPGQHDARDVSKLPVAPESAK